MHEVSVAVGMAEELIRIASDNNAQKVLTVNLKIGKMSGIVTDSLKFAFDAVKLEYPALSATTIRIEEIPLVYECGDCGSKFQTDEIHFPSCRDCGSFSLKLLSGEEMNIANVEVET